MTARILQLTDCHLMADPQAELKGIKTRAGFDAVLRAINARYTAADRIIVTGDLTHDEQPTTYATIQQALAGWRPRLRVLPGNHDERAAIRQAFDLPALDLAGRLAFAEQLGGWRLIGLDSHWPGQVRGQLGGEQLHWLAQQLDSGPPLPTCLFVHHPPIAVNCPWLDQLGLDDAPELLEIVRRRSQVRVICCGHIHQELTAVVGSVVVLASPATSVQFRPQTEALEVDATAPGFRILDLADDGRVQTRIERVPMAAG